MVIRSFCSLKTDLIFLRLQLTSLKADDEEKECVVSGKVVARIYSEPRLLELSSVREAAFIWAPGVNA